MFAQHLVADLLHTGMLDAHLDDVRARYRLGRDAMAQALHTHMRDLATCRSRKAACSSG
jgi:DNA-binding transcriptional MocR family regulator